MRPRSYAKLCGALAGVLLGGATVGCAAAPNRGRGDDDESSTGSGDGGDGGAGGSQCEGIALDTSGSLDLDLKAVSIAGSVTVNGAPLPDDESRGALVFSALSSTSSYQLDLSGDGPLAYAITIPPDTYDVRYVASGCETEGVMPCGTGRVLAAVALDADGALDIDIPVIAVQGNVLVNGAAMPTESSDRGAVFFAPADLGDDFAPASSSSLGSSGPATYQLRLVPGHYSAGFSGNSSLCSGTPSGVPCNAGVIVPDVGLEVSGALDIDVPTVAVTGAVTVNGAAMASEAADRGALSFVGFAGNAISAPFGSSGPALFGVSLIAGSYDVAFVGNAGLCNAGPTPSTPCNTAVIAESVLFQASGSRDFDVPAVTVQGQVTVNGAVMPSEVASRGSVSFARSLAPGANPEAAGAQVSASFPSTGAALFAMRLIAGTYDIAFEGNASLCDAPASLPTVPCNSKVVRASVDLASDGALDIDVTAVTVQGQATLNGAPFPDAGSTRGGLVFESGARSLSVPAFGASGLASYATRLVAGTYAVSYAGSPALCDGMNSQPIPCNSAVVIEEVSLSQSGSLDVDVPAISLSGNITVRGVAMPDAFDQRGSILFSRAKTADVGFDAPILPSGVARYAVSLVPGPYVVTHAANPYLCEDGAGIPCASQILLGCP